MIRFLFHSVLWFTASDENKVRTIRSLFTELGASVLAMENLRVIFLYCTTPFFAVFAWSSIFPAPPDPGRVPPMEVIIHVSFDILMCSLMTLGLSLCVRNFVKNGLGVDALVDAIPFELHLPGHNYTGPGTDLSRRLTKDLKFRAGFEPVNRVDWISFRHDLAYLCSKKPKNRAIADMEMLDELDILLDPIYGSEDLGWREKLEGEIARGLISLKCALRNRDNPKVKRLRKRRRHPRKKRLLSERVGF